MSLWTDFLENPSAERVYLVRLGIAHDNGASIDTRTLYMATHPKEFTNFYYPCVAGVPRLNRSLQDVFTGWSMPSWGKLILLREDSYSLTPDNEVDFDDLVSGEWECAGRSVEILFGGDDLAEGDYQTIMKGMVDKVENWDNEKIEISILDMQEQLGKKEVAKNKIAKMAYPSSWNLLKEDCSDISDWTDNDNINGVSEVSPAGQFRMDANAAAANNYAGRYRILSSLPNTSTFEIRLHHDALGSLGNNDYFSFYFEQADERLAVFFCSDGLFIHDTDSGNTEIGTNLVKYGGSAEWQTWRFVVTFTGTTGDGTCDVYLKDSTHDWVKVGTAIPCSKEGSYTDGKILIQQYGYTTNGMLTHIDYIKIASGLYATAYPNAAESIIGKRKPFAIGDCKNIKPVLVDKTARKYLVHDTNIADLTDVVTVYAKGVSVAFAKQLADGTFTLNAAQDGTITCDVQGFKYDGSYIEHIGDVFKGLLITCGGISAGDILTADITAINTAFPYDLWAYVTGEDNVLDVLDQLSQGLPLWHGFTREAKFEIKEFLVPSGSPDLSLDTRSIHPGLKGGSSGDVTYRITVKYDENPSKMSANSIGTVTDDYKAWLEEQWREEISEDSDVLDLYLLAEKKEFETALRDRADATAVGGKWLTLLKAKRFVSTFLVKSPALACHLGDVIKITFPRFGLSSGVLHRVIEIEENYNQNEYVITAWR